MKGIRNTTLAAACLVGLALALAPTPAAADFVILDDLIVDGSACIGNDCVDGESFGFDTLRLKENNLRIHFDDTSSAASFPTANWRIVINDSSNGGGSFFAVEDDSGDRSFKIENGARANALYVEDDGDIGIGTATPVADVHIKTGNTPTLRLEQDGSSGFASQTWDLAGNEANFFVRDATSGSTLPFRIFPGAPSNALTIEASGDIGMGTTSPTEELHVRRTVAGATRVLIENTGAVQTGVQMINSAEDWRFNNTGTGTFVVNAASNAGNEFTLMANGDLEITGGLVTGTAGSCTSGTPCDGVFRPEEYTVESIDEHAEYMWSNQHLRGIGPTAADTPINITQKTTGLIHELEKAHIYIEQLHKRLERLEQAAAADAKD